MLEQTLTQYTTLRVHFPGAINSEFTSEMSFLKASDLPAIPTYRVMDANGEWVDKSHGSPQVSDEEVLTWYKNMLQGAWFCCSCGGGVMLTAVSEHYGRGDVRGATAGPIELLHGKHMFCDYLGQMSERCLGISG